MSPEFRDDLIPHLVTFLETTADFIGVSGSESELLYLNPAARKRLGIADIDGLTTADLFPPEAFAQYYEVIRPQLLRTGEWSGEVLVNTGGGVPVLMHLSTVADVAPGGLINANVVYAHDLPEDDAGAAPRTLALDASCSVLDRAQFDVVLADAVGNAASGIGTSALVAVHVEFEAALTAFGESVAAEVLRVVAGRMARFARTSDVVGHIGPSAVGLLLHGLRTNTEARRIARAVYDSFLDAPIVTSAGAIQAGITCGFAIAPPNGDVADLVRKASQPKWRRDAVSSSEQSVPRWLDSTDTVTMHAFRVAWSQGNIQAHVRPVVELASGALVGYEGRARWQHANLGTLGAANFIDMIADSALASPVDLFVARELAEVLVLRGHTTAPRMYAPVSERLLVDIRAEQHLSEIADAFHLAMGQICLEVRRASLTTSATALHDALGFLRDAGITLVLTDVETAADVARAAELGFGEVHLARRVAAGNQATVRQAVSEIAGRAHDCGMLVAASHVPDGAARGWLTEAGCDLATGDLFGGLVPADSID
ncbi:MAG TPA: EAL domain-containing protein [Acidimicrobiia bacterium]